MAITLVLGGARSGKSALAERLAAAGGRAPVYIATAEAGDAEMTARIAEHRARRGAAWTTIEEPLEIAGVIAERAGAGDAVLVDCLTLWLSNLIAATRDLEAETTRLEHVLSASAATVVLVSNEVGAGIVPDNALARAFRDALGVLNQRAAALADDVVLCAAGLALPLKRNGEPIHDLGL